MGNAFTVAVRASYSSNVAQGVRQDAGSITQLAASTERAAGRATNSTRALGMASVVAGKLLLVGVGGAMAVSAKAAIEFESSMAEVAKTTDLAGTSFQKGSGPLFTFGQALRDLSLRTPVNVNDLAELAALGGQLGIEVPNLLRFTEVMAAMGVTTNMSATEAAQGFARFANIMRTPQGDFERLGNIVVELGNNLATTESEILRFGTRLAPIGRIVGMTEEEVFGLSAALTSLGVPAERGGTALQKWFILAKQAVDSGGESLGKFAQVAGMTANEFGKLFRESPARAMAVFVKGLDEMNSAGMNVFGTLESLGLAEVRTTQVLLAMAGGYQTVADSIDMAVEQGENGNALFEEAARRYGTTASQIELLGNSFRDLQIEVGNFLLGSGGLHAAVEIFRNFFAIVKDNLPLIGRFVAIMGAAGLLRVIASTVAKFGDLGHNLVKFWANTKVAFTGTQKLTGAMRAAQGAAAALSVSMNIALGVAGLVAAAWAWQATKAAELKAALEGANEAVKEGVDPTAALAATLDDMIADKDIQRLERFGLTTYDLARAALEGKSAIEAFPEIFEDIRRTANEMGMPVEDVIRDLDKIQTSMKVARNAAQGLFSVRRNELVRALQETGANIPLERMKELADQALEMKGLAVSADWFVEWVTGARAAEREVDKFLNLLGRFGEVDITPRELHWSAFALGFETAEEAIEAFTDRAEQDLKDFNSFMAENFEASNKIVRSGFPVWDEYEQVILGKTTHTWQEVLASQERFLEDQRAFIDRLPSIMEMGASADTLAWLEGLEPGVRAAIARLSDAQLQELITGQNKIQQEMTKAQLDLWAIKYPGIAREGFTDMVASLMAESANMGLVGEQAASHLSEGLQLRMMMLSESDRPAFLEFVEKLFVDPEFLRTVGLDIGNPIIDGLLEALRTMSRKANFVLGQQISRIKATMNDEWEIASPSKWWKRHAGMWMEGLKRGVKDEVPTVAQLISPENLLPIISGMGPTSNVTNNRTGNYNLTINTGASGDGIAKEAQTMLTLLGIVNGVEAGAGR